VRQIAYLVSRQQKAFALNRLLEFESPASAIIFCRTRVEVDELTDTLKSHGYAAQALHGGMEQRQRDRVMQLIRDDKADVLVATDVAARGLDIDHISHVINYDIPTAPEVYVHRIGRTGRIGREGVAITLVDPRERRTLAFIESVTKQTLERAELPSLAALQAKRLEVTRAALQTRIVSGGLDETKAFVLSLAEEFDLADIAAAAIAMAQDEDTKSAEVPKSRGSEVRESRGSEVPRSRGPEVRESRGSEVRESRGSEVPRPARRSLGEGGSRRSDGARVNLAFSVGEQEGIGPGDLVGAIAGESGIDSQEIGAIRVHPTFATVEVPEELVSTITSALRGKKLRGNAFDLKVLPAEPADDRPRKFSKPGSFSKFGKGPGKTPGKFGKTGGPGKFGKSGSFGRSSDGPGRFDRSDRGERPGGFKPGGRKPAFGKKPRRD
jgi:ATP-dependent RNA helicase DeaD